MNSEIELTIKEYYDVNEKIKGIKRIVITDLSRMKGDRVCIFGFDDKKRHIRPVIPHIGINEGYIFDTENKQIIKPFAEVEFDFIRPLPEPPHNEDWEINTGYKPKRIRNLSENESKRFLEEVLDDSVNAIFEDSIQNHRYLITGGSRSIGTIRVKEVISVNYSIKQGDNYEYRITFSDMNGDVYNNLPITDLAFRKHCDDQRFQGKNIDQINHDLKEIFNQCDLFLRIGLSRLFHEKYWLLVSGVHSFPDYREKESENKVESFAIQNNSYTQKTNSDEEVEILSNDINSSRRAHAIYLLGEKKDPAFVEILCKATKDPDGNVRRMAASALGKIGNMHAVDALICLLYDDKPQVRQYAIKALGDIGNEKAIPELMKFKDDPIPYINTAIDTAINKIKKMETDLGTINESDKILLSIPSDSFENQVEQFDILNKSCSEINKIDGTIIAQKIISCVSQVGENFGKTYIADVLCGSKSKKVINYHHDTLPIYGAGKEYSREQWQDFIKELIQFGYLKSEGEMYPVIRQTQKSLDILSGKERILLTKPAKEIHHFDENFDRELFENLRILRKNLADEKNIPPYIIFHDSSLKAMATHFPQDQSDFHKISGVGEKNILQYGKLFLEEINSYCKNHKIEPKTISEPVNYPETTTSTMQTPTSSKPEKVGVDIVRVGMGKSEMIGTLKKIIRVSQDDKEDAHLENIISKAAIFGIDKDAVKDVIQLLKRTGEIYEVSDERFRIVE
jgi:hypothetical protein